MDQQHIDLEREIAELEAKIEKQQRINAQLQAFLDERAAADPSRKPAAPHRWYWLRQRNYLDRE